MAYEKLSKGSTGSGVRKLQETLNRNGYSLSVDGVYGDKTQSAVRDYQRKKKLAADGIAGEATWQKLRSGEAELPVVTPTYEVMGNGGAAVQSVRATGRAITMPRPHRKMMPGNMGTTPAGTPLIRRL